MPPRPGDSGAFSANLKAMASNLMRANEVEWADRVLDVDGRIDRFGYGEGRAADTARQFARDELEALRASPASAAAGVHSQVDYALGWITRFLQRLRPRNHHMTRARRFPATNPGDIPER